MLLLILSLIIKAGQTVLNFRIMLEFQMVCKFTLGFCVGFKHYLLRKLYADQTSAIICQSSNNCYEYFGNIISLKIFCDNSLSLCFWYCRNSICIQCSALFLLITSYGSRYSRMDQVKFVEDSLSIF